MGPNALIWVLFLNFSLLRVLILRAKVADACNVCRKNTEIMDKSCSYLPYRCFRGYRRKRFFLIISARKDLTCLVNYISFYPDLQMSYHRRL